MLVCFNGFALEKKNCEFSKMELFGGFVYLVSVLLFLNIQNSVAKKFILTTDDMENFINPEDLQMILDYYQKNATGGVADETVETTSKPTLPDVGCFGTGESLIMSAINMIFSFNLTPASSDSINTHFYFMSRKMNFRVQVFPGKQFGIESLNFDPKRKTVLIVHGFMSYSGADWVTNMTRAYLEWEDVNVIAVDWSGGSNTFKYWRAVANTRTVGRDIVTFMGQLKNATGLNFKNCHFIGHSLGAQIASFASHELGKVGRITGLDPALLCFNTTSLEERLDPSDADFVDVIHTNGKLSTIGFGFPYPTGHVDFYPNGGIRQPGCSGSRIPFYNTIDQAICSHGRAYLLFTESMTNKNCSFKGAPWDLTVAGLKVSIEMSCSGPHSLCAEMGIRAITTRATRGAYLVITKDKRPYCAESWDRHHPPPELLKDITNYLQNVKETIPKNSASSLSPMFPFRGAKTLIELTTVAPVITTPTNWFRKILNYFG